MADEYEYIPTTAEVRAGYEEGYQGTPGYRLASFDRWRAAHDAEIRREEFGVTAAHLTRQREFSQKTFGPGPRLAGVLDHIRKELVEVEAEPQDMSEWADVVILAFDGALRQGHDPQALLDAILAKQTRNEGREWPDWRTQPTDRAIEHVRSSEEDTAHEECRAELHSWDHFTSQQVDSYWMRCHLLGPHEEHENSETGARWKTEQENPR